MQFFISCLYLGINWRLSIKSIQIAFCNTERENFRMMMKGKMERERKKLNFQLFEIEIVLELVYTKQGPRWNLKQ